MSKGIIWAIRTGLTLRDVINNSGCNDIEIHIYKNGESRIESTWIDDNKIKSRFAFSGAKE